VQANDKLRGNIERNSVMQNTRAVWRIGVGDQSVNFGGKTFLPENIMYEKLTIIYAAKIMLCTEHKRKKD